MSENNNDLKGRTKLSARYSPKLQLNQTHEPIHFQSTVACGSGSESQLFAFTVAYVKETDMQQSLSL